VSFILSLFGGPFKLWIIGGLVAAALAFVGWQVHAQREIGRDEIRAEWSASVSEQRAAALAQSEQNAKETLRRLARQKESQDALDQQLAIARRDAARADVAAGELRDQLALYVAAVRDAPGNTAVGCQRETTDAAIGVLAELFRRADDRAGALAKFADSSRAAGLKCQADYQSLTPP
jgi:uncharacterized iron-regulated membrane protein